jgi:Zn-dependent peptidase ImmA (M78 family)/DNA-binding XRE family transcriptional regulator
MSIVNFRLLRLGRDLRGLSQAVLAATSGVSQPHLSRIEAGMRAATPGELDALAAAMALPAAFFTEPDVPAAAPLFRKRAIRSARANRRIQARINTAVLCARRVLDAGIDVAAPYSFPEAGDISRASPAEASRAIRRAWQLPSGRIDDVTAVVEAAGGVVLHVDFGTDDASAALVSALGEPRLWFLVNTRETAGDRVRITLAHELGHAVMHRFLPVHDEGELEREAYEFAATLTLPPEEFNRRVGPDLTLLRARDLKRSYWISIQAIVKAAHDRDLIAASRYTSLYKQISARGWRRVEPDPVPVETPTIWPAALSVHRSRHGYSDEELAHVARVTPEELAALFPHDFAPRLRLVAGGVHGGHPAPTRRLGAL